MTGRVREDLGEAATFQASGVSEAQGEGVIRFATLSSSMDWRMSKSEPWDALKMHWLILLLAKTRFGRV